MPGLKAVGRGGRARQQAAATDGREQPIELTNLLDQLQGGRSLAGHDERVVVGRHDGQATLCRQPVGDGLTILGVAVVADDFRAVAARGRDLEDGRVSGHDDRRANAQLARGERYALRVVARGKRHHAALALGRRQG